MYEKCEFLSMGYILAFNMKQECLSVIYVIAKDTNNISVCVCVCVLVCVCVFCTITQKEIDRNTKLEYTVVYENSSDDFDIELRRIKVKVTVGVQIFSPFTTIQTVRSYSSTLAQARNLI